MRDGASRPFILSCGIRRFALIASQKTFCFCLYRAIISGREFVCEKKNSKLISKRTGRFLIATPRGRRTYPENKTNRWLITRRCAVPPAKPAVSEEPGFSLLSLYIYGRRAEKLRGSHLVQKLNTKTRPRCFSYYPRRVPYRFYLRATPEHHRASLDN